MRKYALSDHDVLYFAHIPKTAGTTFSSILKAQFPDGKICPHDFLFQLLRIEPEELEQYRLISGHHFFRIEEILRRKPLCITLLRNPVDWVISYYAHIQRESAHHHHYLAESKTLLEFLNQPEAQNIIQNYQTRYIAASPDLDVVKSRSFLAAQKGNLSEIVMIHEDEWNVSEETMLEVAKQRLDECIFVGVTERLNGAIWMLSYLFGWEIPEIVSALNVAPNRPEPDREVLELLKTIMAVDLQLYEYASSRYQTALEETLVSLFDDLRVARTEQESLISTLEDTRKQYHGALEALDWQSQSLERLKQIEQSWGWKFILRFNHLRSRLIWPGSRIEQVYCSIRDMLLGKN